MEKSFIDDIDNFLPQIEIKLRIFGKNKVQVRQMWNAKSQSTLVVRQQKRIVGKSTNLIWK